MENERKEGEVRGMNEDVDEDGNGDGGGDGYKGFGAALKWLRGGTD